MKPLINEVFCPFPWIQYQVESSKERLCCVSKISDGDSLDKNTNVKKKVRLQMLKGERPDECSYCYDIEDKGGWSLRQTLISNHGPEYDTKSMFSSTMQDGAIISEPDTLNIWVGSLCNLACVTCNPEISSKWINDKDILESPVHIPGRFDGIKLQMLSVDVWRHLPEKLIKMSKENKIICLHMAGGEPLMDKKALAIIDFLVDSHLCKRTNLLITTNGLFINESLAKKFNSFFTSTISLSVDGVYGKNDYIRHGSKFEQIEEVINLMKLYKIKYRFSHTVSSLSSFYFPEFHDWAMGRELAISWVSNPDYMRMESLPQGALDYIANLSPLSKYHESIIKYAQNTQSVPEYTNKLKIFLSRNDNKRGVDHKVVFPEICQYLY